MYIMLSIFSFLSPLYPSLTSPELFHSKSGVMLVWVTWITHDWIRWNGLLLECVKPMCSSDLLIPVYFFSFTGLKWAGADYRLAGSGSMCWELVWEGKVSDCWFICCLLSLDQKCICTFSRKQLSADLNDLSCLHNPKLFKLICYF